jgi:predicted molibdopterin-dependent oxidoreductase YjgC
LNAIAQGLGKGKGLAALASTRLPAEDLALFKSIFADKLQGELVTSLEEGKATASLAKLAEELGKPFESSLDNLKDSDAVLVLELDLVEEHQVPGFFIKRQIPEGTALIVADGKENKLTANASVRLPLTAGEESSFLESLLQAIEGKSTDEGLNRAAEVLKAADTPCIIYGRAFAEKADSKALQHLLDLAEKLDAALIGVKAEANSMAAAQLGLEAPFTPNGYQSAFVLLGDEEPSQKLVKRLEEIPFVVVQAAYSSQASGSADVVLPVTMWAEQTGSYLSLDGRLQKLGQSLDAPEGVLTSQAALLKVAEALAVDPDTDWKASLKARIPTVEMREA